MRLTDTDLYWLRSCFPSLVYDPKAQKITGELNFCACYEKTTGEVKIELLEREEAIRNSDSFLCDVFEIEILLGAESVGSNGWPKVHEVGGRYKSIAEKYNVGVIDLHFYPDGSCCLGIKHSQERNLTIKRFIYERVIPFFYRLSYTDRFGIDATRNELWGEYSHGDEGFREHEKEMLNLARRNPGRNAPCPCGSGVKYKKCCLDEIQAVARDARLRRRSSDHMTQKSMSEVLNPIREVNACPP